MNDKPRTGRILRNLSQVKVEERERKERHQDWIGHMRMLGCADPEDPIELAKWEVEWEILPRRDARKCQPDLPDGARPKMQA
jgi:hypothetical protein